MNTIRTLGLLVLFSVLGTTAQAHKSEPFLKRAAATELMQVMHMDKLMEQSTTTMVDAMLKRLPPHAQDRNKLLTFFNKHVGWESLRDDFIKLYVNAFSVQELQDLVKFYKTPTGQKAIQTMPSLMQQGAQIGQARVQAALPELLQSLGINK